jgi:leucyl aminopeptidase
MGLKVINKLKVNIVATIALAENFLGDDAFRPSDIIKSRKGKILYQGLTVEIGNTDAEGRLILADAYTYT